MEKEVVRVWFCNRRQKEKRINPPGTLDSPTGGSSGTGGGGGSSMSWLPPMGATMQPHYASMGGSGKLEWPPSWGMGDFGTLLAAEQHEMGVRFLD